MQLQMSQTSQDYGCFSGNYIRHVDATTSVRQWSGSRENQQTRNSPIGYECMADQHPTSGLWARLPCRFLTSRVGESELDLILLGEVPKWGAAYSSCSLTNPLKM